jgi:ubiquinone/menaquinone biosynthesis C-methylase UbiE
LNIGCGSRKEKGLGVDIKRTSQVDVLASVTNLPFKDACADFVYSRRCLQHIVIEGAAISEIHRVLKLGCEGQIIVASYRGWLYYQLKHLFRRKPYPVFHFYTKRSLKKKLKKAGFTISGTVNVKTRRLGYDICVFILKR